MPMERRFMITGGGTSGHINPALAIADLLVEVAEENGDVCKIIFTGRKILIMGNHDTRKPKDYVECGFEVATRKPMMVEPGVILMHEPFEDVSLIAPNYIYFYGHVHTNKTLMDEYCNCMCVSVERIGFKPIDMDKYISKLRKEK